MHVTDEGAVSTAILEPSRAQPGKEYYEDAGVRGGSSNSSILSSTPSHPSRDNINNKAASAQIPYPSIAKKPPPMPKPYGKSKEGDETDSSRKRVPPPIPRPYGSRKAEKAENDESNQTQGTYLFVFFSQS